MTTNTTDGMKKPLNKPSNTAAKRAKKTSAKKSNSGAPVKQRGRPFTQGQSGNPSGRPKGSKNKIRLSAYDLVSERGPRILKRLADLADQGDLVAIKAFVNYLPKPAEDPISLTLPEIKTSNDVKLAHAMLIKAVARGDIAPNQAERLSRLLERQSAMIESADLEARLTALEERLEVA